MFYFKELFYRLGFLFLTFILLFFILYNNKETLVLGLCYLLFYIISAQQHSCYFIYTHPTELLSVILSLIFFFCFFFLLPYINWSIIDFFKSGLFKKEYTKLKIYSISFLFIYAVLNLWNFYVILPIVWSFFKNFIPQNINIINFYFELKIKEYFSFLLDFIFIVNFFFIVLFFFYFLFLVKNFYFLLKNKNFLYFIIILLATIFSPPDVIIQIILFIFLIFFFEINILILIFYKKFNKVTY
uniref:SecY-independent transporter protein n=1 Tax=Synura synuroidea TaxID=47573 RepID=Q9MGA2_9STRA|nr:SecY-independent transporter protein [Synura synuroidea]AAF36947.1 SecY-independent transporter protein [Synura synuroidea]